MSLNPSGLTSNLQTLFSSPGATAASCAATWASAMSNYSTGVVPPSTTVAAAASALSTSLATAFGSGASTVANVEAAFAAFAASVGVGMLPLFAAVPPSGPVGFATEFAKPPSAWATTHAAAASLWSAKIHTWMSTGTATLVAPPNTPTTWL